jgi:hypothetical protein
MKMKFIQFLNVLGGGTVFVIVALVAVSCGDDDASAPRSDFFYEADERVVTFDNRSKGATSYAWDFGDGETSTEENPVHEYPAFGLYTASLVATGPGGTTLSLPDEITLAKKSGVVIDGNLADWADIPVSTELGAGTLTKVKVDYDALRIYFYVEGTDEMQGFFDLYLNVDNDFNTAFATGQYPMGLGAEYLIEGNFAGDHDAILYGFDLNNNDNTKFDFNVESPVADIGTGFLLSSDLKTVPGGKALEFSMLRATLNGLSPQGFAYGFQDLLNWGLAGSIPEAGLGTSQAAFVDLTK